MKELLKFYEKVYSSERLKGLEDALKLLEKTNNMPGIKLLTYAICDHRQGLLDLKNMRETMKIKELEDAFKNKREIMKLNEPEEALKNDKKEPYVEINLNEYSYLINALWGSQQAFLDSLKGGTV